MLIMYSADAMQEKPIIAKTLLTLVPFKIQSPVRGSQFEFTQNIILLKGNIIFQSTIRWCPGEKRISSRAVRISKPVTAHALMDVRFKCVPWSSSIFRSVQTCLFQGLGLKVW